MDEHEGWDLVSREAGEGQRELASSPVKIAHGWVRDSIQDLASSERQGAGAGQGLRSVSTELPAILTPVQASEINRAATWDSERGRGLDGYALEQLQVPSPVKSEGVHEQGPSLPSIKLEMDEAADEKAPAEGGAIQPAEEVEDEPHSPGSVHSLGASIMTDGGAQQWVDTERYAKEIRQAFTEVPRLKAPRTQKYMKLLVVGESGLGKTTFIKNLFAAYSKGAELAVGDGSLHTSPQLFQEDPLELCTEIVVQDVDGGIDFHYLVQDTPGVHQEESLGPILDYIRAQTAHYMAVEQDPKRSFPMTKVPDSRVDVCLYFIAPHALKPLDLHFMARIGSLVPVVPIMAKADSMTSKELDAFRIHISDSLLEASKTLHHPVQYPFPAEALTEAGMMHGQAPFAVVCSDEVDLSVGRFWPVRSYPWGRCESLASGHSDLAALKALLFEVAFEELKADTDRRYYVLREAQLTGNAPPDMILALEGATAAVEGRKVPWWLRLGISRRLAVTAVAVVGLALGCQAFALAGRCARLQAEVQRQRSLSAIKDQVVSGLVSSLEKAAGGDAGDLTLFQPTVCSW